MSGAVRCWTSRRSTTPWRERRIGGAIIDTWYTYPSPRVPRSRSRRGCRSTRCSNVVMTPHMSGWTEGTVRRRQQTIAANINRLARGAPLANVLS